jgi:hypothetical protein
VTLVEIKPPTIFTVAEEINTPAEFFTVPVSLPEVASWKFAVVAPPAVTPTGFVLLPYPVLLAVKLSVPAGTDEKL